MRDEDSRMPDLLIELLSEEIPARMQAKAAEDLNRLVSQALAEAGLACERSEAFVTPRRLALAAEGLPASSPDVREERKGPRIDAPDKAVEGFARSVGATMDQLEAREDKKGKVWFAVVERVGRSASDIAAEVLAKAASEFPWPKSMRWGGGSLRWIRPLRSILCILYDTNGAEVVPLDMEGIASGDFTCGHRFLAPEPFRVNSLKDYEIKLERAGVILRAEKRSELVWNGVRDAASERGLEAVEDRALLAEVAGLVEWPVVLTGEIGDEFLDLPSEVLRTSMREHQKFFSMRDPKTERIVGFATVADARTADNGETILAGNRKVLAARLSDARFFWENDVRAVESGGMAGMAAALADVTFHGNLGSQAERIERIASLARRLAPLVGAKPDVAEEAARVAKADLASQMVYEFPELQGTMGKHYSGVAGFGDGIPEACEEHYSPAGPFDEVPSAPVSICVGLADRLDVLAGFWAIDEKPTGSKDPFALRRAALGVIRLALANGLRLKLGEILPAAFSAHAARGAAGQGGKARAGAGDGRESVHSGGELGLLEFFHDRLKAHLRDEGVRHDVIDACLSMPGNDDLTLLVRRAEALARFLGTGDGENLLSGFRRAGNILLQAEEKDGAEHSGDADAELAEDPAETALFGVLAEAETVIRPAMDAEDFEAAMRAMAGLRTSIDAFFEAVQINAEDERLRRNRLRLLRRICAVCLEVADLSRIEG